MQDLCATGSSPLTQGKQAASRGCCVAARLIPAHAGKTRPPKVSRSKPGAHPRSRGENSRVVMMVPFRGGSSPLTRGKRHHGADCNHLRGLIPAHAGKTHRTPTERMPRPAHPRSRGENGRAHRSTLAGGGSSPLTGENADRDGTVYSVEGSSPLTRGKRVDQGLDGSGRGLIPTHAGKTDPRSSSLQWARAHPRSRGENDVGARAAFGLQWLIPAHAGKTRAATVSVIHWRAHPRSRGENRTRT